MPGGKPRIGGHSPRVSARAHGPGAASGKAAKPAPSLSAGPVSGKKCEASPSAIDEVRPPRIELSGVVPEAQEQNSEMLQDPVFGIPQAPRLPVERYGSRATRADRNAFEAAAVREGLARFKHIAIDACNSRTGFGDIAAGLMTASDLVTRLGHPGPVELLVTRAPGLPILERMLGRKLKAGDTLFDGKLVIQTFGNAAAKASPVDLVLVTATTGEKDPSKESAEEIPLSQTRAGTQFQLSDTCVLMSLPVFANSENRSEDRPNGAAQMGDQAYELQSPGLGITEAGIYADMAAQTCAGLSPEQRLAYILHALEAHQDPTVKTVLGKVLQEETLAGGELGLVYGVSKPETQKQFWPYVEGLAERAAREGRSFVLVTPSAIRANEAPAALANSLRYEKLSGAAAAPKFPERAEPGKVYILETDALPQQAFVGLIFHSKLPPLVAGDGALSAAVRTGKPFLVTQISWNREVLKGLRNTLLAGADRQSFALINKLFGGEGEPDLSDALAVDSPALQKIFQGLAAGVPTLTEKLVAAAEWMARAGEGRLSCDDIGHIRDAALRPGLLARSAIAGDAESASLVADFIEANPRRSLVMTADPSDGSPRPLPSEVLRLPRIRQTLERMVRAADADSQRAGLAGLLAADPEAALEAMESRIGQLRGEAIAELFSRNPNLADDERWVRPLAKVNSSSLPDLFRELSYVKPLDGLKGLALEALTSTDANVSQAAAGFLSQHRPEPAELRPWLRRTDPLSPSGTRLAESMAEIETNDRQWQYEVLSLLDRPGMGPLFTPLLRELVRPDGPAQENLLADLIRGPAAAEYARALVSAALGPVNYLGNAPTARGVAGVFLRDSGLPEAFRRALADALWGSSGPTPERLMELLTDMPALARGLLTARPLLFDSELLRAPVVQSALKTASGDRDIQRSCAAVAGLALLDADAAATSLVQALESSSDLAWACRRRAENLGLALDPALLAAVARENPETARALLAAAEELKGVGEFEGDLVALRSCLASLP